ncbi:alpha/beta hydrolase [Chitinophaga filiformis]|uniref:alpha/beta hydrolase n=1 Tax=Chitinophaga filiformis TaxID=104663 RepID=UPI001F2EBC53|nr:alpha/beta hydrolase [Chitinophaga filiformis]MCF6402858.1 alpha/beta hydrolase [Chitinophaga filiformis]MCF6403224.1 alpha/beta hydrolase [Chitinophaga filiformis]
MKLKKIAMTMLVGIAMKANAQKNDPGVDPRIDPQIRVFLKGLNDAGKGQPPIYKLPGTGPADALTALQNQTQVDLSGIEVTERVITQDGISVPVHIVRPAGVTGTLPVIVFYHGGVWLVGNFENHKRLVRDLVVGTNAVIVFPDYTLIPQAKYPTQINEAYATLQWVAAHGAEMNVDPARLAIAGNSVGGNMSAAIALMAKDKNGPAIKMQVLLYPAVGADFNTESYKEFADGRFLTRDFMEFGWNLYAPNAATRKERYAVPMVATKEQLTGLPRTLIQTAENDPLRDEGEAYGKKLREAGVNCVVTRYVGVIHDFGILNGINKVPAVQESVKEVVRQLNEALK